MKPKAKTTGALNKAEKFILNVIKEEPHFTHETLAVAVCHKLGISDDGWKYADVQIPKLPPEYQKAINKALDIGHEVWTELNPPSKG